MSSLLKGVIRNGRVELNNPVDLPEGTEVIVSTTSIHHEDSTVSSAEIEKILEAMNRLLPLQIEDSVAADLEKWERQLNERGNEHIDPSMRDVFR